MSIRINWKNPSQPFDEIQIFRTNAPFTYGAIPADPIVTLTTETTWLDTTALQDTIYYYTIVTKVGDELILTPSQLAVHVPYTGPGSQEILCGDMIRGFFGLVAQTDLFTNLELIAAVGGIFANNAVTQTWAKFAYKGKILFIPLMAVSGNASWQVCYDYGLAYGMDNNGPANGNTRPPKNQKKVVSKNEHDFMLRLPRANNSENWSGAFPNQTEGEWYGLIRCLFNAGEALSDQPVATYFTNNSNTLMAELNGAGICPTGYVSSNQFSNSQVTIAATGHMWRPVLELIY